MKLTAITNNGLLLDTMNGKNIFEEIIYVDGSVLDVFIKAKDSIRNNYVLMLNPLIGNTFPNEAAFKTIVLSENKGAIDFNSLNALNAALKTAEKSMNGRMRSLWTKKDLEDFKKIDLLIIERWINKIQFASKERLGDK